MVTLPETFTATKYPGYFWDTKGEMLYSLKTGGVLRPMKMTYPNRWNNARLPYYGVSHEGKRRWLTITYLKSLKLEDSEIPVRERDDSYFGKIRNLWQPC